MFISVIAYFRYKVNRNQGEHGDADQYQEHALDGKDIAQFTDDGGKRFRRFQRPVPIIRLATMERPLGAIFWAITTPRGREAMLKPPANIVAG